MSGRSRPGVLVVAVALLVVFAGCSTILPGGTAEREVPDGYGEVGGVAYDDDLDIDASDGLSEAELEQFVNRTMARIEAVRKLKYEEPVDVEIIDREQYRQQRESQTSPTDPGWENQIWRALFLVGEERDAAEEVDEAFGNAAQGFYRAGTNEIVIISDSETATVNKDTLVHELTHALQDQRYGLEFGQSTRDEQAAYNTLIEGEADLVAHLYLDEWCKQWDCIRPEQEAGGESSDPPRLAEEISLIIAQPYRQGPTYVQELKESGGWEAVNERHENPPRTTAEIIDSDGVSEPTVITIPDRSTTEWERFDQEPTGDSLGAASLYAMLAANGVADNENPRRYNHPAVRGWTGDRIVPYHSGTEYGYVWELAWENGEEAEEFADAFEQVLTRNGGLARGANDYIIEDGSFAGAYRVVVDGDRVRIVGGPDRAALDEIHGT
ncbi:Hvo_1808 family surface protein [Halovenus sp. HT40]|uniref:Hvo_1808 family surface protein n=1 Tax=Halovenus sp. HT40 TaxID=3126691 RepID=UPI00300F11F0